MCESINSVRAAEIKPSDRQLSWQQLEFYAFIHFGVNTFTNMEWGTGKESPEIFNPTELDANQWVKAIKSAGMSALILTCKHHDGFCLWPSQYTEHSVKSSPWKSGKGDVVREVAEACKKEGLKFGVYLSPWDMHEKKYGDSEAYNQHFLSQLEELLTNYGEIFCVWFDGACGEGENGVKQVYDWDQYYKCIRSLQPGAVISVCGPDVRWCGNEAGNCRTSEWSVVPVSMLDLEKIQDASQKIDDGTFASRITSSDEDLGSRKVIADVTELAWYPAEVNTSIRPGWFYHEEEDDQVMSIDQFLKIYYGSVGGNGCFLLNIPPDQRGLIQDQDVAMLKKYGETLEKIFDTDLAEGAKIEASEVLNLTYSAGNILNNGYDTYWCPKEGTEQAEIGIELTEAKCFDRIVLMENIKIGQRIEEYVIMYEIDGKYVECYHGTTIGYKRICCFDKIVAKKIKFKILQSRWQPTLSKMSIFNS